MQKEPLVKAKSKTIGNAFAILSGLSARFAESHSEMGHCPPDLRRVIPKWGIVRPICGEPFRDGALSARFVENHFKMRHCPPKFG